MGLLDTLAKPLPGEDDDEAPIDGAKAKKVRAMARLRKALAAKDDEAAAEAFADAFAACESYESEGDTSEGDGEEF